MIGSKEAQREPLPDGTTVIFLNNKEIVIRSPLAENRNALFYEAFDRNTGRVIVMKEFFPGHWVRHDSALTLCGYILQKMKKKEWKRVLFVPTGALLSTVSFNEGNSIPGIAHAVMLEGISGSGKGVGEWTM